MDWLVPPDPEAHQAPLETPETKAALDPLGRLAEMAQRDRLVKRETGESKVMSATQDLTAAWVPPDLVVLLASVVNRAVKARLELLAPPGAADPLDRLASKGKRANLVRLAKLVHKAPLGRLVLLESAASRVRSVKRENLAPLELTDHADHQDQQENLAT